MADNDRSLNPTCEDYHSSEDSDRESVVETFRRSPAANVAAKRSHPSDLGADKTPVPEKVGRNSDLQSDSGYSSHTAATMSSADSGPSAKSQSPPAATADAAPNPPPSPATKRRPTIGDERKNSAAQNSPRKPLQRSGSVTSRSRPPRERRSTAGDGCQNPNCSACGPTAPVRGRARPSAVDSALDISCPPSDQRSQRSDPVPAPSYVSRQSPIYARQPDPYMRGPAVVQPAQSARSRRSSSTTRSTRPASYHGGDPSQGYWVPGMPAPYPSPPQEHGPPPAMSAYQNIPHHPSMGPGPYPILGATPPGSFYPPPHSMQMSPPYDAQRPPMPSRNSSNFNARRPVSGYGPALVTQDKNSGPLPSARFANAPQSARQERYSPPEFDSESSEYESSEEYHDRADPDRALMPPPPQRRPGMQRARTTQVTHADRRMSQSLTLEPPRNRERDPRASMISTAAPSRSSSKSRPALIQYPKAQSYETAPGSRVTVENSRSRRQSHQNYDVDSRRRSKIYPDEGIALPERPRARTDADRRRPRTDSKLKDTTNDVEAYLQRTRGSDAPFNDQVHKAAKRASRPSEAGSSRSKGSDKQSRVSQSNRTTVTGGGEIRLRVDASAPVNLQFKGDMEGRTLQINPTEDGMADIVIGNSHGNEHTYRSERGSVLGKKSSVASQARREAEENSVRSGRSSQARRDRDRDERRVLKKRGTYS